MSQLFYGNPTLNSSDLITRQPSLWRSVSIKASGVTVSQILVFLWKREDRGPSSFSSESTLGSASMLPSSSSSLSGSKLGSLSPVSSTSIFLFSPTFLFFFLSFFSSYSLISSCSRSKRGPRKHLEAGVFPDPLGATSKTYRLVGTTHSSVNLSWNRIIWFLFLDLFKKYLGLLHVAGSSNQKTWKKHHLIYSMLFGFCL